MGLTRLTVYQGRQNRARTLPFSQESGPPSPGSPHHIQAQPPQMAPLAQARAPPPSSPEPCRLSHASVQVVVSPRDHSLPRKSCVRVTPCPAQDPFLLKEQASGGVRWGLAGGGRLRRTRQQSTCESS